MAIEIPRNLYTAGAVSFDASPSVNFYAQLQARRQAQEQAKQATFDDYIRNLNTKVTSAGKRTQDTEAFQDMYNKWQQFGLENRDRIMKNDINTRMQFDRGYQELLNFVNESKTEEEKKKPLVEILLDPNKRSRLSSRVIDEIELHDQPLYIKDKDGNYVRNENRKSIDYTSNLFDPQFDMAKGFEGWAKGMKMGKDIGSVVSRDPVTGQAIRGFTERYDPEQVKQISLNAARSVKDNRDYGNYYQLRFEKLTDDEFKTLNDAFQSVYGKEVRLPGGQVLPNSIDSPEEVAAADAIIQAQSLAKKGEEAVMDRELANQRAINKIYIGDSLIRGRKGAGSDQNDLNDYDIFKRYEGKYVNKILWDKTDSGRPIPKFGGKEVTVIPFNQVDVNDKKLIGDVAPVTNDDGTKYYIVLENGDWEGKGGQVIDRANVARRNMDATTISEEKRGRLSDNIAPKTNATKQPSIPTYKKSDLINAGWSEQQIKQAVSAGKIKVN